MLYEKITKLRMDAMKAKDKVALETLRNIKKGQDCSCPIAEIFKKASTAIVA